MKLLSSNNLRKLCSQTAWWSTFFCATLFIITSLRRDGRPGTVFVCMLVSNITRKCLQISS